MTTKPPKIPKQLRVALQARKEHLYDETGHIGYDEHILGYAIAYAPTTQAYKTAKQNADKWAYANNYGPAGHRVRYNEDENGKMWYVPGHWESSPYPSTGSIWVNDEPVIYPDNVQPIIIDNEPLEGFKIDHMISRYRGNKLWRIIDPRGFQLEITSGCLEDLIFSGAVDKGLIVGPCVWRTGKILQRV